MLLLFLKIIQKRYPENKEKGYPETKENAYLATKTCRASGTLGRPWTPCLLGLASLTQRRFVTSVICPLNYLGPPTENLDPPL